MLIKCKACGKEISIQSDKCLDCGQPNNSNERNINKIKEFLGGLIVFAIIIFGIYLYVKV